jgi:phosphate:Na+ symporter
MFIAGFGVFLFGIHTLSANLEKIGGNNIRKKINRFSNNRFSAMGFGFVFTTLLQSSTASIVMIIGFTSAGMLTLFQALALTIGSNIASTVPGFLISFTTFNITSFFCALAGIGVFILVFAKKTLLKNIATVLIGFALLFIGMDLMGNSTSFLNSDPTFINFFETLTNPVILILLGTALTFLTQSSLGTIAILMTLVGTAATPGAISIGSAACIVYGANVGTALTTALIGSISATNEGRRVAIYHIIYSLIGAVIFGLLTLTPWIDVCLGWLQEPTFKVAFVNLIFNILVAIVMLPLINPFIYILRKILPNKKKHNKNPLIIDDSSLESTAIAIAIANEKITAFYNEAYRLYNKSIEFISEISNEKYKKLYNELSEYNTLINKFNMFVVRISSNEIQKSANKEIEGILNIVKQLERINRNCIKFINVLKKEDKKITYSVKLKKYINIVTQNTNKMFEITRKFVENPDCNFLAKENPSSYEQALQLSHENSETKLSAKTYVIQKGFGGIPSTEKNTSYIELMSYLGLISNNILDIVFSIVGQARGTTSNQSYEQLILDGLETEEKEEDL